MRVQTLLRALQVSKAPNWLSSALFSRWKMFEQAARSTWQLSGLISAECLSFVLLSINAVDVQTPKEASSRAACQSVMVCQHLVGKFSSDIETWGQHLLAGLNGINMLGKVNACRF
ncbi:hypothetical protein HZ326_9560 [Fusarium oxysporum f. sp. albedinis]|nr:hypothetical protein HZ326_9560 [Fusarium oxysporum f. sp. albedinis]